MSLIIFANHSSIRVTHVIFTRQESVWCSLMKAVNEAREVLLDALKRREYDRNELNHNNTGPAGATIGIATVILIPMNARREVERAACRIERTICIHEATTKQIKSKTPSIGEQTNQSKRKGQQHGIQTSRKETTSQEARK